MLSIQLYEAISAIAVNFWDPVDLIGFCPMDEYEMEIKEFADFEQVIIDILQEYADKNIELN